MIFADIHCDILSLPSLVGLDPALRCTPSQLLKGLIGIQVCAMFTETSPCSVDCLKQQNQVFFTLTQQFPFIHLINRENIATNDDLNNQRRILVIRAIENASGLVLEKEPLKNGLKRLEQLKAQGPLAYVSLVWNYANRFGGGALEPKALTDDGKVLLQELDRLAIPVDLSHASERLSEDILDYATDKLPSLITIASHSNFLSVQKHPRNLRDDHAKEIARRGGVIGLCVIKPFVGKRFQSLQSHILKAMELRIIDHLCFGADFFYSPYEEQKFFSSCANAADYGAIRELVLKTIPDQETQKKLLYTTAKNFLYNLL